MTTIWCVRRQRVKHSSCMLLLLAGNMQLPTVLTYVDIRTNSIKMRQHFCVLSLKPNFTWHVSAFHQLSGSKINFSDCRHVMIIDDKITATKLNDANAAVTFQTTRVHHVFVRLPCFSGKFENVRSLPMTKRLYQRRGNQPGGLNTQWGTLTHSQSRANSNVYS